MTVAKPIKKIFIIALSLILAILLLTITNAIAAHLFVAKIIFYPPEPKIIVVPPVKPKTTNKKKPVTNNNNKKVPPKIVKKTVYVPPTKEDLERIQQELETSDPLPPIVSDHDDDSQRPATRVAQSVTSTVETLLKQHDQALKQRDAKIDKARNDIDELGEAYASLAYRMKQDTTKSHKNVEWSNEVATHYAKQLTFLKSVLARNSLRDLGRKDVTKMLTVAMQDIEWVLGADELDEFFQNFNNTLLAALVDEGATSVEGNGGPNSTACHPSYLALEEGKSSEEFTPPKVIKEKPNHQAMKTKPIPQSVSSVVTPPISNETARESHLNALVENIKRILSRRDLSSLKLDETDPIPDPIDDEAVDEIRSSILPMVNAVRKKRDASLAREEDMRNYWIDRTHAAMEGGGSLTPTSGGGDEVGGSSSTCASTELVELMVAGGLEAFRRKETLRSCLVNAVFNYVQDDPDKVMALSDVMRNVVLEEVFDEGVDDDGEQRHAPPTSPSPPGSSSSWKVGKRSVSYAVDGPLLHRGVVGWIDSFVDAVSGYNDHVDEVMDWIVGEDGVSVGTSVADAFSTMVRKVPFPEAHVGRMKKAGILGGRTRVLLEE